MDEEHLSSLHWLCIWSGRTRQIFPPAASGAKRHLDVTAEGAVAERTWDSSKLKVGAGTLAGRHQSHNCMGREGVMRAKHPQGRKFQDSCFLHTDQP